MTDSKSQTDTRSADSVNITEEELITRVNKNRTGIITIDGKRHWLSKNHIKQIKSKQETSGGIIPLIPILAGLASLGTLAGEVATTVAKAKEAQKYSKTGSGIYLNPSQGKGIKDFLKNLLEQSDVEEEGKKAMKNVLKNLSNGIKVKVKDGKHGSGIYLRPYPQ